MHHHQRLALRSAYFHATYGDNPEWPQEVRPMPLSRVASVLRGASGPYAEARRLRAATALMMSKTAALDDPSDPIREAVLSILSQAAMEAMAAAAKGEAPKLSLVLKSATTSLGSGSPACTRTEPVTSVQFDAQTNVITGHSTLSVRRDIEVLRHVLDPQHWDIVMSDYFRDACVAECDDPDACKVYSDYAVSCDLAPPTPGSTWNRLFYEHYELDIGQGYNLVTFKNLLEVDSNRISDTEHHVDYSLARVLYGKVGLLEQVGGGLDVDGGWIHLHARDDGWVDVEATKLFRLAGWKSLGLNLDPFLNWWTSVTIRETLDSAYEAVCKDV